MQGWRVASKYSPNKRVQAIIEESNPISMHMEVVVIRDPGCSKIPLCTVISDIPNLSFTKPLFSSL